MKRQLFVWIALLIFTFLSGCAAASKGPAENSTTVSVEVTAPYQFPFPVETEQLREELPDDDPMEAGGIRVDNDTPLDVLLQHSYPLEQLQAFFAPFTAYNYGEAELYYQIKWVMEHPGASPDQQMARAFYMDEIDSRFPIECLRCHARHYYTVYRVDEGGYYFVFFASEINQDNEPMTNPRMSTAIYLNEPVSPSAFCDVTIGKTTLKEITEIDPAIEIYWLFSSGEASYSLLSDGRILEFRYQVNDDEWRAFLYEPDLDYRKLFYVKYAVIHNSQYQNCNLGAILPEDLQSIKGTVTAIIITP